MGLTLANIQMHEARARCSNDHFVPRINRLLGIINVSGIKSEMGSATKLLHQQDVPLFDAFYELKNGVA